MDAGPAAHLVWSVHNPRVTAGRADSERAARSPYPGAVMTATPETAARTYEVRTYGCQMNVHDSERLTGLLEEAGYVAAGAGAPPDAVGFQTRAGRGDADNKPSCHPRQL